jgi:hypothetical protein
MQIRIPNFVARAHKAAEEWVNVPIIDRGKIYIVRLDLIIASTAVAIGSYYLAFHSWPMAVIGVLSFLMMAIVSMWIF